MNGFTSSRSIDARADSQAPMPAIEADAVFVVEHPFCRDIYRNFDEDGPFTRKTWRPGVRYEAVPPDGGTVIEADAFGAQILTVVAVFKLGRFPTRVFYTRRWRDPTGKEFGKGGLRIKTMAAFKRLISGYRDEIDHLTTSAEDLLAELARFSNERGEENT